MSTAGSVWLGLSKTLHCGTAHDSGPASRGTTLGWWPGLSAIVAWESRQHWGGGLDCPLLWSCPDNGCVSCYTELGLIYDLFVLHTIVDLSCRPFYNTIADLHAVVPYYNGSVGGFTSL